MIRKELDFQVASVASELHDEDRRAGYFTRSSLVQLLKALFTDTFPNTLATAAFGSLDHHGEADLFCLLQTLLPCGNTALHVHIVRDSDEALVVDIDLVNASS